MRVRVAQIMPSCGFHRADGHNDQVESLLHNRTFLLATTWAENP